MGDSASAITVALAPMDLVGHYAKIELVPSIVRMVESVLCPEINANVEMGFMDQDAIRGNW